MTRAFWVVIWVILMTCMWVFGGRIYQQIVVWRGINFVLNNADSLVPREQVTYLTTIYKVIKNDFWANKLQTSIVQARTEISEDSTFVDKSKVGKLEWERDVSPVVEEITRNICRNIDMTRQLLELKNVIEQNKQDIFPDNISVVDRYIINYSLGELGISTQELYKQPSLDQLDLISDIDELNYEEINQLYGLTHSIITASLYYEIYPNSGDETAKEMLNNALLKTDFELEKDMQLDIFSQIVVSLKLLKEADNTLIKEAQKMIMSRQNKDGSWGRDQVMTSQKIHVTIMAILALSDWGDEFRAGKIFCY